MDDAHLPARSSVTTAIKKTAIILLVIGVLGVGLLATCTSYEAIPDRARFMVNEEHKWIVPVPVPSQFVLHELPTEWASEDDVFIEGRTVTWAEIKRKEGPYKDFDLPPGPGWDDFVFYGKEQSLFTRIFLKPESRWDEYGYWRY